MNSVSIRTAKLGGPEASSLPPAALWARNLVPEDTLLQGVREFSQALESSEDDGQSGGRFSRKPIAHFGEESGWKWR
jgi:hypothetical protein